MSKAILGKKLGMTQGFFKSFQNFSDRFNIHYMSLYHAKEKDELLHSNSSSL